MSKVIRGHNGYTRHMLISPYAFTYEYADYEMDEYNGRCYRLEDSMCTRTDCDGKLVKRRISKAVYHELYKLCQTECEE